MMDRRKAKNIPSLRCEDEIPILENVTSQACSDSTEIATVSEDLNMERVESRERLHTGQNVLDQTICSISL